jgi:hypoxanthine-guanine phosphoribosyltransferase
LVGHIVQNDVCFRHSYLGDSFYSKVANITKSYNNSECVCVCVLQGTVVL